MVAVRARLQVIVICGVGRCIYHTVGVCVCVCVCACVHACVRVCVCVCVCVYIRLSRKLNSSFFLHRNIPSFPEIPSLHSSFNSYLQPSLSPLLFSLSLPPAISLSPPLLSFSTSSHLSPLLFSLSLSLSLSP